MLERLFIGLHFAVKIRHFDRPRLALEPHIFSFHKILKMISRVGLFIKLCRAKSISNQNVSHRVGWSAQFNLNRTEIPKILLRKFENCIDLLWDRLLEHICTDSEVRPSVPEALQFTKSNAYRRSGAFDEELQRMSSRGLLNRVINMVPFELHIPRYQFCGPRTRMDWLKVIKELIHWMLRVVSTT